MMLGELKARSLGLVTHGRMTVALNSMHIINNLELVPVYTALSGGATDCNTVEFITRLHDKC